jgi:hypothetical protein
VPLTVIFPRATHGPAYITGVTLCHKKFKTHDLLLQCFSTAGPRPVPDPGINYTGPREVLLEVVILVFRAFFMNKYFIVEVF